MNYSNELKVGLSLIIAALIFFFGIRYFQDLPLLSRNAEYVSYFDDSGGLVAGNAVRISGVKVGTVEAVALDRERRRVRVNFNVDSDMTLHEGATAAVTGIGALGGVRLAIAPGPQAQPEIPSGGVVPSTSGGGSDLIGQLSEQAPQIAGRADTLLLNAGATFEQTSALLEDPDSDLRQTLAALRRSADALNGLLQGQDARLGRVLENADSLSADLTVVAEDLRRFTSENADSLGASVQNANRVLARLDRNLEGLEATTQRLDAITAKIDRGEGTLGRLVNDDGLYVQLDSAAAGFNAVLDDLQQNPERYLDDVTLFRLF